MTHWYRNDGSPCHFVPNEAARKRGDKNAMRETTVKDARKLNLNPSVTTVTKIVDKGDFLLEWTIKQALYSAAVHPDGWPRFRPVNGVLPEDDADFCAWAARCRADAKKQVAVKAERGSILHDAMMKAHHDYHTIEPQYLAHVDGMMQMLKDNFGERRWIAELTFAHPMGFGGSVDLHTDEDDDDQIVLDYKFKDFGEGKRAEYFVYDEHRMQLGGYRIGLRRPKARCFNAFGSISDPGRVLLHAHTEDDIRQGEAMFRAALALFQAKTGYTPKWDA
jgi:hypothetical protein